MRPRFDLLPRPIRVWLRRERPRLRRAIDIELGLDADARRAESELAIEPVPWSMLFPPASAILAACVLAIAVLCLSIEHRLYSPRAVAPADPAAEPDKPAPVSPKSPDAPATPATPGTPSSPQSPPAAR